MKDEFPEQLEPQEQDVSTDSFDTFGASNNKSTEPFASSSPITSVEPLAASEVEPSTSDIVSGNETSSTQAPVFFSEPTTVSPTIPSEDTLSSSQSSASTSSDSSQSEPVPAAPPVLPLASAPLDQFNSKPAAATTPVIGGTAIPPKKSRRKKLIIIGALVGIFALLGAGSVAAYNLWYQNPDKVLGDALINVVKAKTVTYTGAFDINMSNNSALDSASEDMKLSVKVNGKNSNSVGEAIVTISATIEGKDYSVSGAGLIDKDANLFIRANDLTQLLESLPEESDMSYDKLPSYYKTIIDKIDNKWIRVSADDVREFSDDSADTQTCVEDVFKKLQEDKELSKELLNVYKDNKFIVIDEKLPAKDGSLGYVVDVDTNISKDFAKAADKTKFGKQLQKCDDSFKFSSNSNSAIPPSNEDSNTKTRVEVWVDRWSHQLTKLSFTAEDNQADARFVFEPKFDQQVTVEAPKDFIPLKDLKKDIEDAYAQYMKDELMKASSEPSGADLDVSLLGTSSERTL